MDLQAAVELFQAWHLDPTDLYWSYGILIQVENG